MVFGKRPALTRPSTRISQINSDAEGNMLALVTISGVREVSADHWHAHHGPGAGNASGNADSGNGYARSHTGIVTIRH